jgi:hypothetical protein
MIELRVKMWRGVGAAALVGAGIGLAACQPAQKTPKPEAPQAAAPVQPGAPAAGGEQGEAGAADAYAGLAGAAKAGLRLQHLKGFLLAADRLARDGKEEDARVLVQQGILEVLDPGLSEVGDLDLIAIRRAGTAGEGPAVGHIKAAIEAVDAAQAPLGDGGADRVKRMLALARGLYSEVVRPEGVDAVEYAHSLGAALGASQALDAAAKTLKMRDGPRFDKAKSEMATLLAMWPSLVAPAKPTPSADVAAQVARVELALSGF